MRTDRDRLALERLLGTVGEAMTTPGLVLDADTPPTGPPASCSSMECGGRRCCTMDGCSASSPCRPARPAPAGPAGGQLGGPFPRHERLLASLRVWQFMHAGPMVVATDQPLAEAARLLADHRVEVLPVVDGHGRPVGIIAAADVIHALSGHARTYDSRPPGCHGASRRWLRRGRGRPPAAGLSRDTRLGPAADPHPVVYLLLDRLFSAASWPALSKAAPSVKADGPLSVRSLGMVTAPDCQAHRTAPTRRLGRCLGCRGHLSPTGCTRLARAARQWRLRSSSHSVGAGPAPPRRPGRRRVRRPPWRASRAPT